MDESEQAQRAGSAAAPVPPAVPATGEKAEASDPPGGPAAPAVDVIIVGFGLPGRFVAELLDARDIGYAVVELNPSNAKGIAACGKRVICGDARNVEILK